MSNSFGSVAEAGAGHALAETAFLHEGFFQLPEELVEEIVGLVDHADEDIGYYFGRAGFQMGPICPIKRSKASSKTVLRLDTALVSWTTKPGFTRQ